MGLLLLGGAGPAQAQQPWPTVRQDLQRTGQALTNVTTGDWTASGFGGVAVTSPSIGPDGNVFIGREDDAGATALLKFDPVDGSEITQGTLQGTPAGEPVITNNYVFVATIESGGQARLEIFDLSLNPVGSVALNLSASAIDIVLSAPAVDAGNQRAYVTAGQNTESDSDKLVALDYSTPNDPNRAWKASVGSVSSGTFIATPVPNEGPLTDGILAAGRDGELRAVSFDGTTTNTLSEPSVSDALQTPAVAADGTIYLMTSTSESGSTLYSISNDGNTQNWNQSFSNPATAPVVGPDEVVHFAVTSGLVSPFDATVHARNSSDGSEKWTETYTGQIQIPPVVDGNGSVYAIISPSGSSPQLLRIGSEGGTEWSRSTSSSLKPNFSGLALAADRTVYAARPGNTDFNAALRSEQILEVASTTPSANGTISQNGTIDVTFSEPIPSQTGLADSIVVRGSQSGVIGGTASASGTPTVTYTPSQDFAPGETVTVTLLSGITDTRGATTYELRAEAATGPAAFPLSQTVSTNEDGARAVAVGDLDGDGDRDLVVGSDLSGSVTRYMNQGNGTFGSGTTVSATTLKNPTDVALADIDGQNGLDIVVSLGNGSDAATNEVLWYPNDGDGTFGSAQNVATSSNNLDDPRSVATGDLDGDGDVDVVVSSRENSAIRWYENKVSNSNGFTEQDVYVSTSSPRDVAVGDINNDGAPDVAWTKAGSSNQARWASNDGSGNFGGSASAVGGSHQNPLDIELADVDGNGNLDAIIAAAGADSVKVVLDNGPGDLTSTASGPATNPGGARAVHVADVTGEGDPDVLAVGETDNSLYAFTNDGNGNFSTSGAFETSASGAEDIVAADVDGDDKLDPVAASYGDDTVAFYPNIPDDPVIRVDVDATGAPHYGTSWGTAVSSLQEALKIAESSDEIWIAEGVYTPDPGGTDPTKSFTITSSQDGLQIYGGFQSGDTFSDRDPDANLTVLSGDLGRDDDDPDGDGVIDPNPDINGDPQNLNGDNSHHVLFLDGRNATISTNTVIDGVTITAGQANSSNSSDQDGGGLYCDGYGGTCNPTLRDVTFAGNYALDWGGALFNLGRTGGDASPLIVNARFENNVANNGAAIYNRGSSASGQANPTITNTIFANNRVVFNGAGIYNYFDASPTISSSSFAGNEADNNGGAIFNYDGSGEPTINNAILWGNVSNADGLSGGSGDEIYNRNGLNGTASPPIAHTIVQGSGGSANWSGPGTDNGGNLDANPLLVDPDNGDLRLNWASPAIDAGDAALLPQDVTDLDGDESTSEALPQDLAGAAREQGPTVDIGAYEGGAAPSGSVLHVDASNTTNGASGGTWGNAYETLQAALEAMRNERVASGGLSFSEIQIAKGVYYPDEGPGITAQNEGASFVVTGKDDGLTIKGGYPTGGGSRDVGANPTVLSGDIDADNGGADNNKTTDGITPTASDISGNNSHHVLLLDGGGGVESTVTADVTLSTVIDGVVVTAGQADGASAATQSGGGMYCDGRGSGNACSPTLRNVIFTGNAAPGDGGTNGRGGAIYNDGQDSGTSSPAITNATFTGNEANLHGGAVYNQSVNSGTSNPQVTNVTFTDNVAGGSNGDGGAIFNSGGNSTPSVTNTILWGNSASVNGNEIYNASNGAGPVSISHSIVQDGDAAIGNGTAFSDGTNNLDGDPLFVDAANGNVQLNWASPAIDAGNGSALPSGVTTDLAGEARTQGSAVDLGAYEGGAEPSGVSTLRVDSSKTTGGTSGSTWGDAYGTLQAALGAARNEAAASGNLSFTEITVAAGTYFPDEGPGIPVGKQDTSFVITGNEDGLQLKGGYPSGGGSPDPETNVTVLSGDIDGDDTDPDNDNIIEDANPDDDDTVENLSGSNAYHVLVLDGGGSGFGADVGDNVTNNTVLDGVTVTAGNAVGSGSDLEGGGLFCDGGGSGNACSPTITDVTFAGNNAARGGAMYTSGVSGTSAPTITGVVFSGNSAVNPIDIAEGGALFNNEGSPEITDAVFRNNMVNGDGGAIFESGSIPTITNTVFVGNSAVNGGNGGAAVLGGATTITNVTFTENSASDGNGGAISVGGDPTIQNSILWGNTASTNDEVDNGVGATPTFEHSLIQGSGGSSSWDTNFGADGGGNIDADPLFINAPSDVRLSGPSPAIDAGDGSLVSASQDLAENPRNQGANVDLGAYELGPVSASASSVTVSSATATADGSDASTLTIELRDAQNNPISGLSDGDFTLSGLGDASVTTISEPSTGTYKADLTNTTAETVTVTVEVDGTTLNDTPTVDFVPGSPAAVSIGTISSPQTAGQQFDVPLTVEDANGNEVSSFSGDLNLTLAKGTSITPSTVTLESSSRSVSVTLTDAVSSEQITAEAVSDNSISGASNTFDVEAGPAASVGVATQPGDATAGQAIEGPFGEGQPSAVVRDANGNPVSGVDVTVSETGGYAFDSGTTTVTTDGNGVATFTDLQIKTADAGYELEFAIDGADSGVAGDASVQSNTFEVTPAAAAALAYGQQPTNAAAGATIDPPVEVRIEDSFGNLVTSATDDVSISLGTDPTGGSATLSGTLTQSATSGIATFDDLSIGEAASGYTLSASASGLGSRESSSFTVASGAATALAITGGDGQSGQVTSTLSSALEVKVTDSEGNPVSGETVNFSITNTPSGATGQGLSSTSATTDGSGLASVDLTLGDRVGTYEVTAGASGLADVVFSATATPGPPVATADPATSVGDSSAALNGAVNPNGADTRVYVNLTETTTGVSVLAPIDTLDTNLTADQSVSETTPDTLRPGTEYRYEIVAATSADSVTSSPETFVTDPSAPVGVAEAATAITDRSATLNGTVNPAGAETRVYFDLENTASGDSAVYAADTLTTSLLADQAVSFATPDTLEPATSYSVELSAANAADSTMLETATFTTEAGPPVATIEPATSVADSSATLQARATPNGAETTVTFEYGLDTDYGQAATGTESPLTGTTERPDSASVAGLLPGTEYHYRAVASSSAGSDTTGDRTLVTDPVAPVATTDSASGVTDRGATLHGTLNPGGDTTEAWFRYYPSGRPAQADTAFANESPVGGTRDTAVSASVTGLDAGTAYVYKVVAANAVDTTEAVTDTFSTQTVRLVASRDTGRAGVSQIGRSGRPVTVRFENEGEATLTELGAAVEGTGAGDFEIEEDGLSGEELASGEAGAATVAFTPSGLGRRAAHLVVSSAEGASDTTRLLGRGARLSVEPGEVSRGSASSVDVVVEGGFSPQSETLKVRKGGARDYQPFSLSEEEADPLRLSATVPDTLVTTRGIDYYVVLAGAGDTLTVPAGGAEAARQTPAHLPVEFNELTAPVSVQPEIYRMMTVSARPDEGIKGALASSYGSYDPEEWRVLRWDPAAGSDGNYVEYPSIDSLKPGAGFWLITAGGDSLSLDEGETVSASDPVRIPVEEGWNQVGSPFGHAVRWDTVQAATGLDTSLVDGPVGYEDGDYQYPNPSQARLRPWEGTFVRVPEADTLVVPPVAPGSPEAEGGEQALAGGPAALRRSGAIGAPATGAPANNAPANVAPADGAPEDEVSAPSDPAARPSAEQPETEGAPGRLRSAPGGNGRPSDAAPETTPDQTDVASTDAASTEGASKEKDRYTLRIGAWPRRGEAHRVWLGLRDEAKRGRDALDFAQAPPIGRSVRLSVQETISGEAVPHAGSFKPPSSDGRAWTLVLTNRSEKAQGVRLRLQSEGPLPAGQQRYVLDLDAERRIAPGATLDLDGGGERRLKVIVGTESFARSESKGVELSTFKNELRANYPNPFGDETTVAYTLKDEREVTIEIYDVLGRRVRTLVRNESQEAGLHEVRWRGETRYGKPAGSGVYFYRIEAGDFTATQKMVLVR